MQKIFLKLGKNHTFSEVTHTLHDFGYEKIISSVLVPGQYSTRGGVLKISPVNKKSCYVIDFFGDEIEQIYSFDALSEKKIENLLDLEVLPNRLILLDKTKVNSGDYVVHDDHGIGIFIHLSIRLILGREITYIIVKYLNENILYVPYDQLAKISTYIGINSKKPKLNRLGSQTWKKTYKKTYENIVLVAKELLAIYATRNIVFKQPRTFFGDWDRELISTFTFQETEDQAAAISDVFSDLCDKKPMDRLICGDVGFGKTEVAIRAAAQTMANGYQVALLVPTTILAEQHYANLLERFRNLPVNIERISRFSGAKRESEIIIALANGSIDLIIGTHKLLSESVEFKNLGLLIVDEEQKFGVKHKEKIKKIEEKIDVLTLTATPIPRTLFMSLSGIRDISQISSVPIGRKPVDTCISKFDQKNINNYISRELGRGGQVYYLHNDVASIIGQRNKLQKEFPGISIEIAHGQMPEQLLSNTMSEFTSGKIKILVCSTIIENGLDLANANTLIVDNSDRFGLSQLYQIRGRIGRSKKQSYALFTYQDKVLTDNAVKRLKALALNNELGKGFDIALHDLEIRGGGNILGKEQHGSMEAVGLVLYSKMLKQAVANLRKNGHESQNLI